MQYRQTTPITSICMEGGICYLQPPDSKSTCVTAAPAGSIWDMVPTDFHVSLHMNNFLISGKEIQGRLTRQFSKFKK